MRAKKIIEQGKKNKVVLDLRSKTTFFPRENWGCVGGGMKKKKRTLFCEDNRLSTAIPHDFQPPTDIDARMGEFRTGVFSFFPFFPFFPGQG